jgi:hypothetical protein
VPSSGSLHNYYCKRTQPMTDSYPNFLDILEHKLLAHLQGFG